MKKFTSKLLLLMTVLAMTFSLAACGNKKNDSRVNDRKENASGQESQSGKKEDSQDKEEDKTQSGDKDEDTTQSTDKNKKGNALYNSVADYVNSDEIQSALNSLKGSLQEGMSIDIVAEGDNKLVYIFTYQTIAHTEGDGMKEALENAIAAQDTTFQQTANSVKPFVNSDQVIVEIRYVDMNGAVIFSKSYTSE